MNSAVMAAPLIKLILGLVGVIAAVLLFSRILPKLTGMSVTKHPRFKMLASVTVGERERVVLMQIGDRQVAVGVAPGRVNALHVLDEQLDIDPSTAQLGNVMPRNWLTRTLKGRRPR